MSIDQDLLNLIKNCHDYEQFAEEIQFYYESVKPFPAISAFEYLENKRIELIAAKRELEALADSFIDYPELESNMKDYLAVVEDAIPLIKKGIAIIRSDASFESKWRAYRLERRLASLQKELNCIRWQTAMKR